jgi:hypothetical protein
MRWSKLAKAMSLSLALAAAATLMPQLATPAHAGAVVGRFEAGDVVKIKTIWGGGFVLNFGGSAGTTLPGVQAQVHWNTSWDNANRFLVVGPAHTEGGFVWHQLKNRWSGKCLAVRTVVNLATVTQEFCSPFDPNQQWAGEWWPGFSTVWIMNLGHRRAGLNTILTQVLRETVGSPIWMETNINDGIRQEWEVQSCFWSGKEQKDC